MICAICEKEVCEHGAVRVKGWGEYAISKCHNCGVVAEGETPPIYALPMYEGKVDFSADGGAVVCPECYQEQLSLQFT